MYTQQDVDIIKRILLDTVMNSIPEEFPQLYRTGFTDGVYAARQVLCNIDLIVDSNPERALPNE